MVTMESPSRYRPTSWLLWNHHRVIGQHHGYYGITIAL